MEDVPTRNILNPDVRYQIVKDSNGPSNKSYSDAPTKIASVMNYGGVDYGGQEQKKMQQQEVEQQLIPKCCQSHH